MDGPIEVRRWSETSDPTRSELEQRLKEEGLSFYQWSNGPNYRYSAHKHSYDKVIYVAKGQITFGLPEEGRSVDLSVGDRLELAAGTLHDAQVGSEGVVCLEAHR